MIDINLPEDLKLEPCPHCGNTELVGRCYPGKDGFRDRFAILCHYDNGGCGAESGHYHTLAEAVSSIIQDVFDGMDIEIRVCTSKEVIF